MSLIDSLLRRSNSIKYWVSRGLKMGGGCEIYPSADFGSEPYLVEIGNHVRVNSGVRFVTHDGGVWIFRTQPQYAKVDLFGKIKVGNNVHIGTNSIIMPGVSIGDNVVIGVNSVVTKNVPNNSVVAGVPARVIETTEEYLKKNRDKFVYTKYLSPKEKRKYLLSLEC